MNLFQSILAFFARLFGGQVDVPVADEPQDGSEVPADSVEIEIPVDDPVVEDEPVIEEDPVVVDPVGEVPVYTPQYLWCIDNGHSKATAGKRSPVLADGRQLFEYEFNRAINALLMTRLDDMGVKYFNVVPEVDDEVSLQDRCNRANSKPSDLPKIFVSIHANGNTSGSWDPANVQGAETWFYGGSANGKSVASAFQKHLIGMTQAKDRGIRYHEPFNRSFFVLRKTSMPAVLIESGFYTSQVEVLKLLDPGYQEKIADAFFHAIMDVEENGIGGIPTYSKLIKIIKQ